MIISNICPVALSHHTLEIFIAGIFYVVDQLWVDIHSCVFTVKFIQFCYLPYRDLLIVCASVGIGEQGRCRCNRRADCTEFYQSTVLLLCHRIFCLSPGASCRWCQSNIVWWCVVRDVGGCLCEMMFPVPS